MKMKKKRIQRGDWHTHKTKNNKSIISHKKKSLRKRVDAVHGGLDGVLDEILDLACKAGEVVKVTDNLEDLLDSVQPDLHLLGGEHVDSGGHVELLAHLLEGNGVVSRELGRNPVDDLHGQVDLGNEGLGDNRVQDGDNLREERTEDLGHGGGDELLID